MNSEIDKKQARRLRGSLNREILLILVLLVGAALLFGGFLFLRFAEQRFLDQHLALLTQATRTAAISQVLRLQQGDVGADMAAMGRLQRELRADGWWFYGRGMRLVASFTGPDIPAPDAGRLRSLSLRGREHLEVSWFPIAWGGKKRQGNAALVTVPLLNRGQAEGLLAVHFSLQPLRDEIWMARRWVFFYALVYGFVLAGSGYWLLRRNVVRPVKNLLTATEKVTGGELDSLLEEDGPSEIARLASSFNQMTRALGASRRQTEATIASLTQANLDLQKTRSELIRSEKLATVGHLAAGMAHEIGNPLAALTGYLAMLKQDLTEGEERKMVELSAQEAERIDRLVRDLLDYAAPGESDPLPFDPWLAVLETIELLNLQGVFKNMTLDVPTDCSLPEVSIDRRKLEQVLVNLLINARDACDGKGLIRLRGMGRDGYAVIEVEDDGAGMSEQVRSQLFEPFFTTKDPGQGRGLGLAVCQRVISDAGGEIQVRSSKGEGSCFTLLLPLAGENR